LLGGDVGRMASEVWRRGSSVRCRGSSIAADALRTDTGFGSSAHSDVKFAPCAVTISMAIGFIRLSPLHRKVFSFVSWTGATRNGV